MNKKVIKRNGKEVNFDEEKIRRVIKLANNNKDVPEEKRMNEEQIEKVFQAAIKKLEPMNNVKVEDIQDIVENSLMLKNHYEIARSYILFRNEKKKNKKFTDTEEKIISVIDGTNESVKQDNANKNPDMLPTQRDYMAGTISKELVKKTWSKTIMNLHNKGVIHIHDTDYRAMRMTNCCLVNLKYMFEHGFMLNSTFIHTPSGFFVACTQATQIAQHVCSQQYGGQTMSWAHIAPFVNKSRIKFIEEVKNQLEEAGISSSEEQIKNIAESRVLDEIKRGVKTVQYQILTLSGTNGQSPFISMAINFEECENKQERDDLLLITEEVFRQRLRGVEDEHGNRVSAIFPKILFFLDEYTTEGGEYFDRLMPLICECENNRMSPDFISTKIQKKLKNNSVGYPCMGAACGYETVSIKIDDVEYNNIMIKDAFEIIRKYNKKHNNSKRPQFSEFKNKCGVYKITHIPTGKYYIGSSKDIRRRICEHRYSTRHYGKLGELYFIDDFDLNNFKYEILKECSVDDLWEEESKFVNLKDDNCVNHKDPKNNGNFTEINRIKALNGEKYSDYENKAYTWWEDVNGVYIKSRGEWEVIEKISYNDKDSPLAIYDISYIINGEEKTVSITEDHPLHTKRGRIVACELKEGDIIFDASSYEEYKITSVVRTNKREKTYDFTTSNDMFDLSGIISHNCRSFLTTEGQYIEDGQIKKCNENFYGRHNNGVITINLPYVALEAKKTYNEMLNDGLEASLNSIFFDKLDEYLEIIYYEGFIQTYNRLKGTKAKVAPILWVWGALAHLDPEDVIDSLITGWRSTYSLGYVGLWETSIAITGKDHVEDSRFAKSILEFFNKKHEEWHKRLMIEGDENSFLNTSSYGTPEENTTEKFANALKRDFDIIKGVNDHGFVTNSYHIIPSYSPNKDGRGIDAFRKLEHESQFLSLSTGGAVSYVEIADMEDNLPVIEAVINHMYNTILYAEFNIRKHMCYNCGYSGEIPLVRNEYGKLLYKCPSCGNIDTSKMNILTRACGYVFNAANGAAQGRYEDIYARLLNLGGGRTYNQFGKIEM